MGIIETAVYYSYGLLADPPLWTALDSVTTLAGLRQTAAVKVLSTDRPPALQLYLTVRHF